MDSSDVLSMISTDGSDLEECLLGTSSTVFQAVDSRSYYSTSSSVSTSMVVELTGMNVGMFIPFHLRKSGKRRMGAFSFSAFYREAP